MIWPRSQRWIITTNNNTSRMCEYLRNACEEGGPNSEGKKECIKKAKTLISRVKNSYSSNVETLMKCILKIGDGSLAAKFLKSHLLGSNSNGSSDRLFEHMQEYIDRFGVDVVSPSLLTVVSASRCPVGAANFVIKYFNTLGKKPSNKQLTNNLIGAFVDSVCPPDKTITRALSKESFPLNAILKIFVDDKENSASRLLSKRVLDGYIWMSCSGRATQTKEPNGPTLLPSSAASIMTLCEAFGWVEYEDVLVEAVEKLCLHKKADVAIELLGKMTSSSNPNTSSDQSHTCVKMASIACEKVLAQPKSVTLVTYKKLVNVIETYCPSQAARFVEVVKTLDVDNIIHPLLSDATLLSSTHSMKKSLGELTFVAVDKLCARNSVDSLISLVEKMAPILLSDETTSTTDTSRVTNMISVACEKALSLRRSVPLATYKKLVKIIGSYCPSKATRLVEAVKTLDVDLIIYPLVSDHSLWSSASHCMKNSLGLLALHCADVLHARVSSGLGTATLWSIPPASLSNISKRSTYSSFLSSPCIKVHDWQVRKADHSKIMADLRHLINTGEIRARSHQPRGRGPWHFSITKLKPRNVPLSSLGNMNCTCSRSMSSTCLLKKHRETAKTYVENQRKLSVIQGLIRQYPQHHLQPPTIGRQQMQQPPPQNRRLEKLNVLYTTQHLGLVLTLVNNAQIVVNKLAQTAPNANIVKPNDMLVGVNGRRFEEMGWKVTDHASFHSILESLKAMQRPMKIMLERWVPTAATSTAASGAIGRSSVPRQSELAQEPRAAKRHKASSEVIDLVDDDDEVQIEEVLNNEAAIRRRVKEAEKKGEIVEIS